MDAGLTFLGGAPAVLVTLSFLELEDLVLKTLSWTTGTYCATSLEGGSLQSARCPLHKAPGKNLVQASLSVYWFAGYL